jgi:hypothetical protein
MSTPIFPTSLPTVSTLSLQAISNLIADDGTVKSYRRISRVPNANDKVQWTLFNDQLSVFLAFYKATLLDGHKWFYIKLPSAKGIVYHIARFKSLQVNVTGHKAWVVDAELELRERAFEVIEPIIDPEPPEGEPDVLSFLLLNNSTTYALDQSRVPLTDFLGRHTLSEADYATFDESTGVINISTAGIYELRCSIAFVSITLFTLNAIMGCEVSLEYEFDVGNNAKAYPNSYPLVGHAAVNEGGPSVPTVNIHKIINAAAVVTPILVHIMPFGFTQDSVGTYNALSIAGSLHRLGDVVYTPPTD